VQATNTRPRFEVVADGQGICSHVGAALLGELADRLGLTAELGRRANRGVRGGSHDRGQVLRDLVVMLADGGDAISDLATLRDQPDLFGQVASTPTAWRIIGQVAADPSGIAALWSALARARQRAWALSRSPPSASTAARQASAGSARIAARTRLSRSNPTEKRTPRACRWSTNPWVAPAESARTRIGCRSRAWLGS